MKLYFFLTLFLTNAALAAPLPLSQAVSEAQGHSPELERSSSQLEEMKWKRTESFSGFLPTLTGQAQYLLDKKYAFFDVSFGGGPVTSVPEVVPTATYGLSARLPIFDGWASVDRYRAAGDLVQAGTLGLDWARFTLEHNVVLLYYKALAAKLLQEVATQNLNTLEDHLKDAQAFKKAGVSTNFDVLRVEVQVSEARSAVIDAGDNVAVARQNLAEAMGKAGEVRDVSGELPVLKAQLIAGLNERSDEERKDIQSLRARAGAADKLESAASTYLVPKLFLFGDFQHYNNRDNSVWSSTAFRNSYDLGVGVSWNIFDGLASVAKFKESIEERVQADKTLEIAELHSVRDFELWKRRFIYFCQVYSSRATDVEKAKEAVRLARAGRRVGARTNTDLLDAEADLLRSQAGLVTSQLGTIEALINVELATGRHLYKFY